MFLYVICVAWEFIRYGVINILNFGFKFTILKFISISLTWQCIVNIIIFNVLIFVYYLIFMTWSACDTNLVILSSLESCNFDKLKLYEPKPHFYNSRVQQQLSNKCTAREKIQKQIKFQIKYTGWKKSFEGSGLNWILPKMVINNTWNSSLNHKLPRWP